MKKRTLKVLLIVLPTILILLACGCPSGQNKNKLTSEEIAEKYKNVPLDPYGYCIEEPSFRVLHQRYRVPDPITELF